MRIKLKANGPYEKTVLDYLEEFASDALVEKMNAGKKTLTGCWSFITADAKKEAKGNCACIPDAKVFGWAAHYFEEDDIKEQKTGAQAKVTTAKPEDAEDAEREEDNTLTEKKEDYIDLSDFL